MAAFEVDVLLAHVCSCPRAFLYAHGDVTLSAEQQVAFARVLERRGAGEPVAYIMGMQEFWSLPLRVTKDTLIPRPETELLVERALLHPHADAALTVADLGTGCGAIALALASARPHWCVVGVDLYEATLCVAEHNRAQLALTNVTFISGYWTAPLEGLFDIIVSNPPYLSQEEADATAAQVCRTEPRHALVAHQNGLADLEYIIASAFSALKPGGMLLVEHGYRQGASVRALFERYQYRTIATHLDLQGLERVTNGTLTVGSF